MNIALGFSLFIHAMLLSLTVGGQTFGLPGFSFPWKERRLRADDLQVTLAPLPPKVQTSVPATAPPEPSPPDTGNSLLAAMGKPAAAGSTTSFTVSAPATQRNEAPPAPLPPAAVAAAAPLTQPLITAVKRPDIVLPVAPDTPPQSPPSAMAQNAPAPESPPADTSDTAQKPAEPDVRERALAQAKLEQEKQEAENRRQAELAAAAQQEAARQAQLLEQQRQEAARAEQAAKAEAARLEAERQEQIKRDQIRQDQIKQELAKQEQARLEAARKEAIRQEQAKQAQLEAARLAQNQLEAAKEDAARQEALRQEVTKEAAQQEAAKLELVKKEQARRERAEADAIHEERLRQIGKQLDAERAQREAAANNPSRSLLPTVSGLRRGWMFGRADPNADLVLYADAMSRKIEANMTFDMVREAVKQPHVTPMVTVAVRADGTVEKVTFVVSSGVAALDEAIRTIVANQAPYGAFPPNLARQYDVVEIRRTWIFDTAVRLQ